MTQTKWVHCPVCGGKTRTKIRPDTEAKNLIVFCPKCKRESVVDIKGMENRGKACVNIVKQKNLKIQR